MENMLVIKLGGKLAVKNCTLPLMLMMFAQPILLSPLGLQQEIKINTVQPKVLLCANSNSMILTLLVIKLN